MKRRIALRALWSMVFALGASLAAATAGAQTQVDLSAVNNLYGIATPGTAFTGGGFDNGGGAYAGDLLGTSLSYNGAIFKLSAAGPNSAVSSKVIPLPAGQFATLSFLGAAVQGAQINQTFIVTYTDGSSSTFTQSLDDFGRVPQNFAGETVVTTSPTPMPYKILASGAKHNGTYRVFGYSLPINAAKTVKSLTLPTNRNVGVLAVDLIAPATGATSVSFSGASTLFGISKPGLAVTGSGLDTNGNAYAGDELGTSLLFDGDTYQFAAPGPNSAATGTTLTLPGGKFAKLTLLGTAVAGAQTNQTFVVTYTDASTNTFTQSLSDWGSTPGNYPNETVVKTLTYKITSTGGTHANTYKLYAYTFALDAGKTVKSIKLPSNRKVVMIAADLIPASAVTTSSVSLSGYATLFGISKPGLAVTGGGLDTGGGAFAGDELGTSLSFGGEAFAFAAPGPDSAATSTIIPLPTGKFSKLTLLGNAVEGAQTNQAFVVTYTDASTSTFTQSLSDWGSTPQNYPNETVAKTLTYKITSTGATHANTYRLYAYSFALDSTKTVKSIQLPSNRKVVIIAADIVGSALPTAASPTFSPLPGTFTAGPTVTLADSTPGASIFFTTNGTPPTTSSTKYTSPFKLGSTTTVEAMAVAAGFSNSPVVIAAYSVSGTTAQTATPMFTPAPGSYGSTQTVTLGDSTSGATIYFTTDTTTPTTSSTKYTGPIAVASTKTIKAIASAGGLTNSAVASGIYTINTTSAAPSDLSYTTPPPLLIGKSVSLSPTVTGSVTKFAVTPTLPSGLAIDSTTGVISGKPKTVTASAPYTITASNAAGSDTFKLSLQVDSGPRVHLAATATTSNGAGLTLTWKVTDGALVATNGNQADWELPPGFGLHFAYVLVSDDRGGFSEGRVVVSTDTIGAPQVIPIKAVPPSVRPASAHSMSFAPRNTRTKMPDVEPPQALSISGNVLLADHNLPGVNEPFFNIQVGTQVKASSAICTAHNDCPATLTIGGPNLSDIFGDYLVFNSDAGEIGDTQTVTAKVQNSNTGTLNFTLTASEASANSAQLSTLLIPGTAAPTISAMSAAFNGASIGIFQQIWPNASGAPSDGYPQQNWFLSYLGEDTAASACQYYLAVGAITSCDSNGQASGGMSFTDWQKHVGIDNFATDGIATVTATYVNVVDLNLTRSHHSIRHDNADMGAYVCNHLGPADSAGNTISVNLPSSTMTAAQQTAVNTAVANANNGKNLVACVAMDYISTPINDFAQFTRFLVFGPNGELLPSVNLDGRGEKFVPGACVACHGGDNYSGKFGNNGTSPDIGAHFLPYDAGNFAFSSVAGFTEAAQETAIYQLNQNILYTDPTSSVSNLISNWYKAGQVLDKNYVPTAWASYPDVYQQVIARSCRTCHAALNGYDWDSLGPANFATYVGQVCDAGNTAGTQSMPNSKVTFDRLWNSRGTSEDQVAKLTSLYHSEGTLPSGSSCVLRAPPH